MIKRILVPLDLSPYTDTVLKVSTTIAKINHAELTGLVVLDIPGIEKSIGPIPLGGLYYAEKMEESRRVKAEDRIHELLEKFKKKCEEESIPHREAELQGTPSEQIIMESIYYDAVMIGLCTYYRFEAEDQPGDSLEKILDETVTPVYGVPRNFEIPNVPEEQIKILVAFDGSFPAARALQRFAQLGNPELFDITILTSNEDNTEATYHLDQAAAYLHSHGYSQIRKERIDQSIIKAMEEKYLDQSHVVVVGAHSKKGMFDFMVGSLTKYLIKANKRAVLIGQ